MPKPETIGRYEIIGNIGRGGFAIVYLAQDPLLNRKVAIKLLQRSPEQLTAVTGSKSLYERFKNEAQTMVKLEQDGIVHVYDFGEHDGQPYLVMRYMPGGTLADRLASGPLPLEEVTAILQRLCTALDKVHEYGFVHRDLKPQNILFDEHDQASLADFGIARLADNTQTTAIVGTLKYMAPEQFRDENIGAFTDIYQLGVMLFEMLTGFPPYEAPSTASLIKKLLDDPVPAASQKNVELPFQCDDVVAQAMAKAPEDRFASATELWEAFDTAVKAYATNLAEDGIQRIGRYEIIETIGSGGMAVVYRAHDPQFNRDVAIKVLSSHAMEAYDFEDRFTREAQLLAQLEHRAIVPVYDFGKHNGESYLVMRLMTGRTLYDRLLAERLDVEEINTIVQRICAALTKIHENNLVHRDIKPANILFDDDGAAYLADFGIARLVEGNQSTLQFATPKYTSPEQINDEPLDQRTDIYQMGIVLYEMLTGQAPFTASSTSALIYKHLYDPIPSVTTADLPPKFDDVIARATAKDAEDRFASAAELAEAFDTAVYTEDAPVLTTPLPAGTVSVRPPHYPPPPDSPPVAESGNNFWVWIIGVVVVGVMGVAIVWLMFKAGIVGPTPTAVPTQLIVQNNPTSPGVIVTVVVPTAVNTNTPQPTDTAIPTRTPLPPTNTPTPGPTNTPTITPTPLLDTLTIGQSVGDKPIDLEQIGNGANRIVLVAGIRGDQQEAEELVAAVAEHFRDHPEEVPAEVALYFLPILNPDAAELGERFNLNGVDLNRNWDTPSWRSDSPQPGGFLPGSGGTEPFSEPETAALRTWLTNLQRDPNTDSVRVISYYHHLDVPVVGRVIPGYRTYGTPTPLSEELAGILALSTNALYEPTWIGAYQPTGEMAQWVSIEGMAAADFEIPREGDLDGIPEGLERTMLEAAIDGVRAVIETATNP